MMKTAMMKKTMMTMPITKTKTMMTTATLASDVTWPAVAARVAWARGAYVV
jgi:hypothetical protein